MDEIFLVMINNSYGYTEGTGSKMMPPIMSNTHNILSILIAADVPETGQIFMKLNIYRS